MKFFLYRTLAVFLLMAGSIQANPISFELLHARPVGGRGGAGVVFKDRIWSIGGVKDAQFAGIWHSPDGQSWETVHLPSNLGPFVYDPAAIRAHTATVFNDRIWVIGGTYWVPHPPTSPPYRENWVFSSDDGIDWTRHWQSSGFPERDSHGCVVFDGKLWLIGGRMDIEEDQPHIYNSSDGITWNPVTSNQNFRNRTGSTVEVFKDKIWVIGGAMPTEDGTIKLNDVWCSSDGSSWDMVTSSTAFTPRQRMGSVVYDDKIWLFGGDIDPTTGVTTRDQVWNSEDGIEWEMVRDRAPWGDRRTPIVVEFQGEMYLTGGDFAGGGGPDPRVQQRDCWKSSDGVNWEEVTSQLSKVQKTGIVRFKNRYWTVEPRSMDILSSEHGRVWSRHPRTALTPGTTHYSFIRDYTPLIVSDGKLWSVAGVGNSIGSTSEIWNTADGIEWEQIQTESAFEGSNVFDIFSDNGQFLIFASKGSAIELWESSDLLEWTQLSGNIGLPLSFTSKIHKSEDRFWYVENDVLYASDDGVAWSIINGSLPTGQFTNIAVTASPNRIWLFGGQTLDMKIVYSDDLWSSPDGLHWDHHTIAGGVGKRSSARMSYLNGQLWLYNGGNINLLYYWDIWRSQPVDTTHTQIDWDLYR